MPRYHLRGSLPPVLQIVIVAVLFGAGALLAFSSSLFGHRSTSVAAEPTPAPLPSGFFQPTAQQWQSLSTAPVTSVSFADVSETEGTIVAADDATTQVFSPFSGRVANVFVTVGDVVRPGTPLFSGVGDEYAQAENDLATALASLQAARTQVHVTQANHDRLVKLLRADGAARKDVEQSAADLATAQAAVRNDEIAAELARAHADVLGAAQAGPHPGVSGAFATAAVVRAPIGGTITQRAVGPGQFVQSAASGGSGALLTISDLSHVFFAAAVTEEQIAHVRAGDRVDVRMDAFPGRTFEARVDFIAPAVDPNTHRIAVRARVENPALALKPGMFGSFRIYTGGPEDHLAVPEQAVIFEGDTARVWITGPHRSIALRYIKAGKTLDGTVEVLSGLRAGDRVVVGGSVFIDREALGGD